MRRSDVARLQAAVLDWYDEHGRRLAFRATTDPYAVLVSEVMAQQTQVARVESAWTRFMTRFPTVASLAEASPADVLRTWGGLGYNRRALHLRRAARTIMDSYDGRVPHEVDTLQRLPGVGPYTARAVAAIAFRTPVAAVDTNVRRVVGRIISPDRDLSGTDLQSAADELVPTGRAADWTHALMDVGATLCRNRQPRCGDCPARAWCRFVFRSGKPKVRSAQPSRRPAQPFPGTQRWLRGRIVARLRNNQPSGWLRFDGPIGEHRAAAVDLTLATLADEGMLERHPDDPQLARLPIGSTTNRR